MFDNILNYFEDFIQKYKISVRVIPSLILFLFFWLIYLGRNNSNKVLPDPFNIFNHIGNIDSVIPALILGYLVGFILTKTAKLSKYNILLLIIVSGTLVGLISNILIETSLGMKLLNEYNVSDPLDVVWGTIFCLISCLTVFKIEDK